MAARGRSNAAVQEPQEELSNMAVANPSVGADEQTSRIPFKGVDASNRPPEGSFPATYTGGKWRNPKEAGKDRYWAAEYTLSAGAVDPAHPDKSLEGRKAFRNYFPYSDDARGMVKQDFMTLGVDADEFDRDDGILMEEISAQVYGAPCVVEIKHQTDSDRFYNVKVRAVDSL